MRVLVTAISMALMSAPATTVDHSLPPPGSHGFNWLDPESRCKALTDADIARITTCEVSHNAFGLEMESRACKVDADTELMVYATAGQCQEALETMQANGP